jgi:heat shock protein HtpX
MRAMFLEDDDEGIMGLFATHPPVAKRIEALSQYAGGRVNEPAPALAVPSSPPSGPATPTAAATPAPPEGPWGERRDGSPGPWGPSQQ